MGDAEAVTEDPKADARDYRLSSMPGPERLYSPLEPFFTKEWRPSEIELAK
jgi:hypothetical protein